MKMWRLAVASLLLLSCTGGAAIVVPPAESPAIDRTTARAAPPRFSVSIAGVSRSTLGWSWQRGCPVAVRDLRLLTMAYWGFDGAVHTGEMVVHERWASSIARVFKRLFEARFPLEKMVLANTYPPNHRAREAANITTSFICRKSVGDGRRWSEHAYGRAVDVNPLQNPYVSSSGGVIPDPWGRAYLDRSKVRRGMITRGGVVWRAFDSIGWRWGGQFRRSKDYHHFSANGR